MSPLDPRPPGLSGRAATEHLLSRTPELGTATRRASSVFFLAGVIAVCLGMGVGLVFFPAYLVIGIPVGIAAALLVLTRPFTGLILYTATFFLQPGEMFPPLGALHVERLVGIATLVSMSFHTFRNEGRLVIDGSRQTLWFAFLVAAMGLSVPTSFWVSWSVEKVVDLLKIGAFYLMIVHLVNTRIRLRIFAGVYLGLLGYIGASALFQYFMGRAHFAQGIDRAAGMTSIVGDPNTLGTTMAVVAMLFLFLARGNGHPLRRALLWGVVAISVTTILLTGSRASFLGLCAGLAVVIWRTERRGTWIAIALLLMPAVFVLMPDQYQERYTSIARALTFDFDGSSFSRIMTWRSGLEMFLDRPLFGVGAGCFGVAHAHAYSEGPSRNWLEAHSLFVQVPAELGLVGAVAFFGFMGQFLGLNRRLGRLLRDRGPAWELERLLVQGMWAGFVVLLVSGIFGHSLFRATWYEFAALGLAVFRIHLAEDAAGETG